MLTHTALLLALASPAPASTYNELWQEDVAKQATSLVKLRILGASATQARFQRLEQLAGRPIPETGVIDRFGRGGLGGSSDEHTGFQRRFKTGDVGYFYLEASDDAGRWGISSPTAGFAMVTGGTVMATFRHSYHQARVSEALYREASLVIFQKLHNEPWDAAGQRAWMDPILGETPADLDGDPDRFFRQHVALESCYHFCDAGDLARIEPFLASPGAHAQISAVRALSAVDSAPGRDRLMTFIQDDSRTGFARVMAVRGLARQGARDKAPALQAYLSRAPTEWTGFGGNIMDPRVGTAFPDSVKEAIEELLAEWRG